MIEVSHLTRRYGNVTAVDDVSCSIGQGEIVGLLGHNGAGKTTLLKVLTGYLEPTSGRITVDGLDIGEHTARIQARIGYLPENCPVWPDMTVIDYLEYQASLHGIRKEDREQAIREAIRRTKLAEKAADTIETLSRGYRQRVGVAQAILHRPDIIILDEPTNGLDPTQIQQMRELIRELAEHATVIISTHILQEVQAVCDRVLIMRAGQLVVDSGLDELEQSSGLLVSLDAEASQVLKRLSGVRDVTEQGQQDGHYDYLLDAPLDAAPQIARSLQEEGLSLYRLQPRQRDLERVFAEVNGELSHA